MWLAQRSAATGEVTAVLAGQPLSEEAFSWDQVIRELRQRDHVTLRELGGRFAIALLDHREPVLYLITDRLAQYPLYIRDGSGTFAFSTSQASFCVLLDAPRINERWIYETFLANFSASHLSFLAGVRRVPAATIVRVNLQSGEWSETAYAPAFVARPSGASDDEEVARAREIFAARMPLYLRGEEHGLIGLSGGFDSRTLLAHFSERPDVLTFTYGVPGCTDMVDATEVARALGLPHFTVPFDAAFVTALPEHVRDTVWISSGLERAARATLVHAYRTCAAHASAPWCVLSGVSADQLFRGHGNVPSIVSPSMDAWFRTGRMPDELDQTCTDIFQHPSRALDAMDQLRADLERKHGDPRTTAAHLGYMSYVVPAEYFAGEACIVDQFGEFRSPFCDPHVVEFAHSTRHSTLGLSKFARDAQDELLKNYLPAALIAANARVASCRIHGKPVHVYAERDRLAFEAYRGLGWLRKRMQGHARRPPLENWAAWFSGPLYPTVSELLKGNAAVLDYVNRAFVESCLERRDTFWLNKLTTVELVLRLAGARWKRAAI